MKTHSNIPFFIPHSGCRNNCVFCSQVKITGKQKNDPPIETEISLLKQTIETALSTIRPGTLVQLAFFGGSFTGIGIDRMTALLKAGSDYIKNGSIQSIRISTIPDYIDPEILAVLKEYGVTDIELGVQSVSDRVLTASGRGHKAEVSYKSADMIVRNGFNFVGQMMIGLPLSEVEDELATAEAIIKMGAVGTRIYPVVVFDDTPLYDMTKAGIYKPLSNVEAAERSALCYDMFLRAGVQVLKVGLHSSESLTEAAFGANHPALGELVKSEVYFLRINEQIQKLKEKNTSFKRITININKKDISKITGHGGKVIDRIKEASGADMIKINATDVPPFEPVLTFD